MASRFLNNLIKVWYSLESGKLLVLSNKPLYLSEAGTEQTIEAADLIVDFCGSEALFRSSMILHVSLESPGIVLGGTLILLGRWYVVLGGET